MVKYKIYLKKGVLLLVKENMLQADCSCLADDCSPASILLMLASPISSAQHVSI